MPGPDGMVRRSVRAMGTEVTVLLPQGRADAAADVATLFAEWEAALSRFRPSSELMRMNRQAGRPVRVGPLLFRVLETALRAAEATDGLYDPTVLSAVVAAGYDRTFDEVRNRTEAPAPPEPRPIFGAWQGVRLWPAQRTVYLPPGVGIDLGGIAKGLAVDAAIERLAASGIEAALVEAGGDLRVLGLPPGESAWPVAVPTPRATYRIALERGALATSGVARRRWRRADGEAHHLIDPRTGAPAVGGTWAVSVGAATCGEAEAAAKAVFLLEPDRREAWLRERSLPALVQAMDGATTPLGGWPTDMEVVA